MIYGFTFRQGEDYSVYVSQNQKVSMIAIGKACEAFGLTPNTAVTHDQFRDLQENIHPGSKKRLTGRHNSFREEWQMRRGKLSQVTVANRRKFFDFSLSAPKSFSVLGLVGKDERVLKWHDIAVKKTLEEMERFTCRVDKRGYRKSVEVTGKICAVIGQHSTSRSLDPNLHTHAILFNATPSGDKNYAVEASEWYNRIQYFTAIYRNSLAASAVQAGLNVGIDQWGAPVLSEISDMDALFSQRTSDINEMVETIEGIVGSVLTQSERKRIVFASRGIDIPEFRRKWDLQRSEFEVASITCQTDDKARDRLIGAFTALVRSVSDETPPESDPDELLEKWRSLPDQEQLSRLMKLTQPLEPHPPNIVSVKESLEYSIKHLFERESVVKEHRIWATALSHAHGMVLDLEELKTAVREHPELICKNGEVTTQTHYARESECIKWVNEGIHKGVALPKIATKDLNEAQVFAINQLLSSKDAFTAFIGRAGTGKTRSLSALIDANLKAGYRVVGCAPSTKSRDVLAPSLEGRKDLTICTLQRFLVDPKEQAVLRANDLLVIDECAFCSVKDIHSVLKLSKNKGFRVLMVGDTHQHTSPGEAGDALRIILDKSKVKREWLERVVRQSEHAMAGHYLKAARCFAQKKSTKGFELLDRAGGIIVCQGKQRIEKLADDYVKEISQGHSCIVVAPTHRELDEINEAIREKLKAGEFIEKEERTLQVHRTLGWTLAERQNIRNLRPGLILEITIGKNKGQTYEVRGVDAKRNVAIGVSEKGVRMQFDKHNSEAWAVCQRRDMKLSKGDTCVTNTAMRTKKNEILNGEKFKIAGFDSNGAPVTETGKVIETKNISLGYAATSHKEQGSTADVALFSADRKSMSWLNLRLSYVAITRGVNRVAVYCENKADLLPVEKRQADRKSALELLQHCIHIATQQRRKRIGIHQDNPQIRT